MSPKPAIPFYKENITSPMMPGPYEPRPKTRLQLLETTRKNHVRNFGNTLDIIMVHISPGQKYTSILDDI